MTSQRDLSRKSFPRLSLSLSGRRRRETSPTRRGKQVALRVEPLEGRMLLSTSALQGPLMRPTTSMVSLGSLVPNGYTPAQVSRAYGFQQIAFNNGTIRGDGSGQTIAIIDPFDQPNIIADLHA